MIKLLEIREIMGTFKEKGVVPIRRDMLPTFSWEEPLDWIWWQSVPLRNEEAIRRRT